METHTYKNTQESSAKYGPCELCGKSASEVWVKTGPKKYFHDSGSFTSLGSVFGHKDCLANA